MWKIQSFSSVNFSIYGYKQEMRMSPEKPQMKINNLKKEKR